MSDPINLTTIKDSHITTEPNSLLSLNTSFSDLTTIKDSCLIEGPTSFCNLNTEHYSVLSDNDCIGIRSEVSSTTDLIHDRIFWIYFIITLFFVIIGMSSIIISMNQYMLIISVFWLLANVMLMIIIYHLSIKWGPTDPDNKDSLICVIDSNSGCFDISNRIWLFINILFIILLILSILWAGELNNPDNGPLRTMSGVLILLGGLILFSLSTYKIENNSIISKVPRFPLWLSVGYLIIWFVLTLYVVITPI